MPSPGPPAASRLPLEDSYLELLADTLEGLDIPARGQFLQRYFRVTTHLDLRENQCVQLWDEILVRRKDMATQLGQPVSIKTVVMDVLSSAGLFRIPIVIEYDELKKLQLNAVTDSLTGLYNRRLFTETFEKELNRARRYGLPLGIVTLDLHRFKEVNDKHGHPRGDEVLQAAATTLRNALRTSDSAFRIGGDEFALLLPQTDSAQALALSRRVETVFAELLQPMQLTVGVSIDHGVANFPQDGDQADQLIRVADERLYKLKHANHERSAERSGPPTSSRTTSSAAPDTKSQASPPSPISIESKRSEAGFAAAAPAIAPSFSSTQSSSFAIQRKAERVSMSGTNAYALIGERGNQRARVIDLGFGGVSLELDAPDEVPESLFAVLHVPILPPVRVTLKRVWSRKTSAGGVRLGCYFVN
ncbi:MAG TPA: GGDEF domain-containing protein [Candidatus Dormibacteraeota bacterium]|nr:GGDEF domain-containing protein [Candidatus Dormibacteraeota bacterium]